MTTDGLSGTMHSVYEDRARNLALENLRQLRDLLAEGHADRCVICGTPEVDGWEAEFTGYIEYYETECPYCNRDVMDARFGLVGESKTGCRAELDTRGTIVTGADCTGPLYVNHERSEFIEAKTFDIPNLREVVANQIEDHHVRYDPEITIRLCSHCHRQVHSDNCRYTPFEPEQSRREWES